jgi:tetratricopeptide (TPR) repeat protein
MAEYRTNPFRKPFVMPLLIALVGILAYANTFTAPFQFDDDAYIVNNPIIRTFHYFLAPSDITGLTERTPTAVPPALRYAFMTRMLGYFTFAVNYHLHGLDVIGYHAVNLAIHIMNGIFVFLILKATLNTNRFTDSAGGEVYAKDLIAGIIAMLFVSHPIQTQAVTYISQRFTSLAAFFYLLSFLLYIRFSLSPSGRWRKAAYGGALVSAMAAMLTKEFAITLPIMLALYDMTFLPGSKRNRIRRLAPFAATLVIIPALVFLQQGTLHDLDSTMRTITAADSSNIPRGHYLLTQLRVVALYLRLLFIPLGQNIDHDVPVYTSLFEPAVLYSFLLLLLLFAAALWLYVVSKRKPEHPELRLAAFGIIWFFITLSVESSIIPLGELVAEYRLYLPSIGISMAVVSLGLYAARNFSLQPPLLYGVCALVVVAFSAAAFLRNNMWTSEITLWADAASKSPARVRPHQNLGMYYGMQGRLEDAKSELMTALALAPADFELHNNLGVLYKRMGAFDDAVREYTIALKLSPGDVMARYNRGNVYLAQGRITEAIREYEMTMKLIPDYDEAHNNLGIAYHKNGQFDAAIREFNRALQLNPQNEHARKNLEAAIRKSPLPH